MNSHVYPFDDHKPPKMHKQNLWGPRKEIRGTHCHRRRLSALRSGSLESGLSPAMNSLWSFWASVYAYKLYKPYSIQEVLVNKRDYQETVKNSTWNLNKSVFSRSLVLFHMMTMYKADFRILDSYYDSGC